MRGLGIDLCDVRRIERALENPRFLERYYTQEERAYLRQRGQAAACSAAAMFAAKEAFLKALGLGIGSVALCEIGVSHEPGGAPAYRLTGEALQRLGGGRAYLSLTHEAGMAAAVCVIEGEAEHA